MTRSVFIPTLKQAMERNKKIWVLLGGVGYGYWKPTKRVINCEASEQAMVDIAVGLALEGQIPFVYAITPHLYRAFESIRIYLNFEQIPVKLIGVGQDKEYGHLGFTHWAYDAKPIFNLFPNIKTYYKDVAVNEVVKNNKPCFINLNK